MTQDARCSTIPPEIKPRCSREREVEVRHPFAGPVWPFREIPKHALPIRLLTRRRTFRSVGGVPHDHGDRRRARSARTGSRGMIRIHFCEMRPVFEKRLTALRAKVGLREDLGFGAGGGERRGRDGRIDEPATVQLPHREVERDGAQRAALLQVHQQDDVRAIPGGPGRSSTRGSSCRSPRTAAPEESLSPSSPGRSQGASSPSPAARTARSLCGRSPTGRRRRASGRSRRGRTERSRRRGRRA